MRNSAYSPIRHLADALFINHSSNERYFIFLTMDTAYTAYFDASGHKQGTTMFVVGGYISTVHDWRVFETEWNAALERAHVPYFHMKKFTANRPPFGNAKWKREETQKKFLSDLIKVIAKNVDRGLANFLPLAEWDTVNAEYCMEEAGLTPFAVSGCMAITAAYEWCKTNAIPYTQVEFVFEDGDDDKGDLMQWTKKCWGWTPSFKPKTSENLTTHPLTPLQACDFMAWEGRRGETEVTKPGVDLAAFKLRGSFDHLISRVKHDDCKWEAETLRGLCNKFKVKAR